MGYGMWGDWGWSVESEVTGGGVCDGGGLWGDRGWSV